jgi:hypothetical protein
MGVMRISFEQSIHTALLLVAMRANAGKRGRTIAVFLSAVGMRYFR